MKGKLSNIQETTSISFDFEFSETPKAIIFKLLFSQPKEVMIQFCNHGGLPDMDLNYDTVKTNGNMAYSIAILENEGVRKLDWEKPLQVQTKDNIIALQANGSEFHFITIISIIRDNGYILQQKNNEKFKLSLTMSKKPCINVAPALEPNVVVMIYRKQVDYNTAIQMELSKRFNFNKGDLANKKVLMIGAGTLGNEVAKNLVFSGIQDLTIVDLDKYEYWNLPRSPMITEEDVGRPKALALAHRMAERSPFSISITGIDSDITMLGWGFFKDFDLVISPVDSLIIRYYVDRGCKLYKKTHITLATGLLKAPYERMVGDVIISPAGSNVCYACTEDGGVEEIKKRISCGEGYSPEAQPQVMGFSSTIAGIASSIAISYLLGKFQSFSDENSSSQTNFYWKYSLSEVGISYKEIEAKNLRALKYSKPYQYCTFHGGSKILKSKDSVWEFGEYGKKQIAGEESVPTFTISDQTTANELRKSISDAFNDKNVEAYKIDLEQWSMLLYSVYETKSRTVPKEVRSDAPTLLIDDYLDIPKLLQKLPQEHIYWIVPDGFNTDARIIKLVVMT